MKYVAASNEVYDILNFYERLFTTDSQLQRMTIHYSKIKYFGDFDRGQTR